VIESLRGALGLYGATFAIGFIAGMFPLVSIELFLVGATAYGVDPHLLPTLIALGVIGHQIAKSVTYYMGAGVFELPRGKLRTQIEAIKVRIERWNRRPKLLLFISSATGIPPLYVMGFVAQPLMKLSHTTFTAVTLPARVLRLTTLVVVTRWIHG
jgi:membrane protein YqaA with SNARE-associated domain